MPYYLHFGLGAYHGTVIFVCALLFDFYTKD